MSSISNGRAYCVLHLPYHLESVHLPALDLFVLGAEDNGAPVQAEWSKKLQDEHAPIEMPEAEDEEEEEEKEEAPDPEIARLKAELAAAKAKSLREKELKREASEKPETKDEPDSKRARTEDPPAEKKAEKPKEPEVDLNARRNTETAAMDAKARYLARKKQKEDAAKGR